MLVGTSSNKALWDVQLLLRRAGLGWVRGILPVEEDRFVRCLDYHGEGAWRTWSAAAKDGRKL
jgi:hypothetical protein